jgi:hypothetical protein
MKTPSFAIRRRSEQYSVAHYDLRDYEYVKINGKMTSHEENKFAIIQSLDGITPSDIASSLQVDKNRRKVFQAGEGAGKSGSFFFFSHDNRFIIKTMSVGERNRMLSMLDDYIEHIKASDNKSLLARIYGIFTIETDVFA